MLDSEAAFAPAHYYIGMTYEQSGDHDSAIRNFARSAEISGRGGLFLGALGHSYGISGARDAARGVLQELQERSRERYVSPFNIMLVHLGLDETDSAFEWFERALGDRTGTLWHTPVDPRFDSMRDEPRFRTLLEPYGLNV